MSFSAITYVQKLKRCEDSAPLSPIQKLLLLIIAFHINKSGVAWPGNDTLASECHCSHDTLTRSIKYLEDHGTLGCSRPEKQGRGQLTRYFLPGLLQSHPPANGEESNSNSHLAPGNGSPTASTTHACAPSQTHDEGTQNEEALFFEGTRFPPKSSAEDTQFLSTHKEEIVITDICKKVLGPHGPPSQSLPAKAAGNLSSSSQPPTQNTRPNDCTTSKRKQQAVELASKLFSIDLAQVADKSTIQLAAQSIDLLATNEKMSLEDAYEVIRERAQMANSEGDLINRFWFTDGKYKRQRRPSMAEREPGLHPVDSVVRCQWCSQPSPCASPAECAQRIDAMKLKHSREGGPR